MKFETERTIRVSAAESVRRLQQTSRDKGLDQMTEAEIDEEIRAARRGRGSTPAHRQKP